MIFGPRRNIFVAFEYHEDLRCRDADLIPVAIFRALR